MKRKEVVVEIAAVVGLLVGSPLCAQEAAFVQALSDGHAAFTLHATQLREAVAAETPSPVDAGPPVIHAGATDAEILELLLLQGTAELFGEGPIQASGHWHSGVIGVHGRLALTGEDGITGEGDLAGEIYVSGFGWWGVGPVDGVGDVIGSVRLYDKDKRVLRDDRGAPVVLELKRRVEVAGRADGPRAAVTGKVWVGRAPVNSWPDATARP